MKRLPSPWGKEGNGESRSEELLILPIFSRGGLVRSGLFNQLILIQRQHQKTFEFKPARVMNTTRGKGVFSWLVFTICGRVQLAKALNVSLSVALPTLRSPGFRFYCRQPVINFLHWTPKFPPGETVHVLEAVCGTSRKMSAYGYTRPSDIGLGKLSHRTLLI